MMDFSVVSNSSRTTTRPSAGLSGNDRGGAAVEADDVAIAPRNAPKGLCFRLESGGIASAAFVAWNHSSGPTKKSRHGDSNQQMHRAQRHRGDFPTRHVIANVVERDVPGAITRLNPVPLPVLRGVFA